MVHARSSELEAKGKDDPTGMALEELEWELLARYAYNNSGSARKHAKCIVESFYFGKKAFSPMMQATGILGFRESDAIKAEIRSQYLEDPGLFFCIKTCYTVFVGACRQSPRFGGEESPSTAPAFGGIKG